MRPSKFSAIALLLPIAALLPGCSPGEKTYDLSGAVTFQNKPVPAGHIVFEPAEGNSGGPGYATIKDGRYDTRILEGRGTVGGPHLVRILGLDGVPRGELLNGMPLFPEYNTTADLPKKTGAQDFDIPKK